MLTTRAACEGSLPIFAKAYIHEEDFNVAEVDVCAIPSISHSIIDVYGMLSYG